LFLQIKAMQLCAIFWRAKKQRECLKRNSVLASLADVWRGITVCGASIARRLDATPNPEKSFLLVYPARGSADSFGVTARYQMRANVTEHKQVADAAPIPAAAL
jgi:hypothetical protein